MKFTTTLALAVLVVAIGFLFFLGPPVPSSDRPVSTSPPVDASPLSSLAGLTPAQITQLTVRRDGQTVVALHRRGSDWVFADGWLANPAEVQPLLDLLAHLHSRFSLQKASDPQSLASFGLDRPALQVEVHWQDGQQARTSRLALGEPTDASYRFVRPTYLRLDDRDEVVRLAPGLIGLLGRPSDLYRQRRLFPSERTVRQSNPQERIERLDARELRITRKDAPSLRLLRTEEGWELREPTHDRLDPDNAEKLLSAVADLWAEKFVEIEPASASLAFVSPLSPLGTASAVKSLSPAVTLQRTGLDQSERTLAVTRRDGHVITLHIGNSARGDSLPPPPTPPRGPAPDSFRFARLEGSNLVFEIQDGKLNDIFVPLETIRDARLARFNSDDAERIQIRQGNTQVVLIKEKKDTWKMIAPREAAADNDKVKDLLGKLSALEATDKDLLSPPRRAALAAAAVANLARPALAGMVLSCVLNRSEEGLGLSRPAGEVQVLVREKARPEDRDRSKERTIALQLGRPGWASNRLYLQVKNRPRIDATDDSLWPLLDRPTSVYRGKQPLEFTASDVQRLELRRRDWQAVGLGVLGLVTQQGLPGRIAAAAVLAQDRSLHLVLAKQGEEWTLLAPISTSADTIKVNDLVDALGKFKVLGFEADSVPDNRLESDYGLGMPALTVALTFSDPKKPARTLSIGRSRGSEPGYYARLDGPADVFALPADLYDQLARPALAYLPSTLWQIAADDEIVRYRIAKAGQEEYQLVREKDAWKVIGPFQVNAPTSVVEQLNTALVSPRAEEYRVFAAQDLTPFGLASPAVKLTLSTRQGKEHSLWLGAETTNGKQGRYARLGTGPGVFVVGDSLARAVDQSALDFLDRRLLRFDASAATSLIREQKGDILELQRQDETWKIVKPTEQPADDRKVPDLVRQLGELTAERIVAYKPKDLALYGLDRPEATLTLQVNEAGKTSERVLLIGKSTKAAASPDDGTVSRFAMVKGAPEVGILAPALVRQIMAAPLAFRSHLLARVPDADLLKLEAGERKITFARPEGTWKVTAPLNAEADHDALEAFFNGLSRLRAAELVREKPTAEQLKSYGLDRPVAHWQVYSSDERKLDLSVGAREPFSERRYARLADRDLVFLLDDKLAGQAVAEYRPRAVWKENIDPAQIESVRFGYARDGFEIRKVDGDWQVVGKPEVKLNQATVSDTLSALRDLKLQHYVRDAGAQLKLYGLEPALLVLEVTTPQGKVTLHLGGLEGGTKQRYARVPQANRTEVFVLDETTSGKLFREVKTLTQPLPGAGLPGRDR